MSQMALETGMSDKQTNFCTCEYFVTSPRKPVKVKQNSFFFSNYLTLSSNPNVQNIIKLFSIIFWFTIGSSLIDVMAQVQYIVG